MANLELKNISKSIGAVQILENISFDLPAGKTAALLGPSGSGKSTLLRLIAGLDKPDRGDILTGGNSILEVPPEKRGTVLIFQDHSLFEHMDVFDNIAFAPRLRRVNKNEIKAIVEKLLFLVGMSGTENRSATSLSGGERSRIALARALAAEPSLLLLDEPFANLDTSLRNSLRQDTRDLLARLETNALLVTHDWEEAAFFGDYAGIMLKGRIVQWGKPNDLYENPVSHEVAALMGELNIINCTVSSGVADTPLGLFNTSSSSSTVMVFRPEDAEASVDKGGDWKIGRSWFKASRKMAFFHKNGFQIKALLKDQTVEESGNYRIYLNNSQAIFFDK